AGRTCTRTRRSCSTARCGTTPDRCRRASACRTSSCSFRRTGTTTWPATPCSSRSGTRSWGCKSDPFLAAGAAPCQHTCRGRGFVNQIWRALGGDGHLIDINTPWGIAWVMALFEGAVAFVMIGAVMKSMDPAMEEASQVLGAGRFRTMLRITLPLVLPGVLGATVFVFAEMLGSFSAALVLGLPNRFYVVTTAMYQLVSQYPPRFPTAAAMGVSLF